MNRTAPAEFAVEEKNTGTVVFNLKGISFFNKFLPHLPVTKMKMAGHSIDIDGSNKENRAGESITAKTWTIIAKRFR